LVYSLILSLKVRNFKTLPFVKLHLGVTEFHKNDTYDTIFKRVDNALYKSKQSGENRVTSL